MLPRDSACSGSIRFACRLSKQRQPLAPTAKRPLVEKSVKKGRRLGRADLCGALYCVSFLAAALAPRFLVGAEAFTAMPPACCTQASYEGTKLFVASRLHFHWQSSLQAASAGTDCSAITSATITPPANRC